MPLQLQLRLIYNMADYGIKALTPSPLNSTVRVPRDHTSSTM